MGADGRSDQMAAADDGSDAVMALMDDDRRDGSANAAFAAQAVATAQPQPGDRAEQEDATGRKGGRADGNADTAHNDQGRKAHEIRAALGLEQAWIAGEIDAKATGQEHKTPEN